MHAAISRSRLYNKAANTSNTFAYRKIKALKIRSLEGSCEHIITTLLYSFSPEDIKAYYHWRWGCEISFRHLKHAAGILYFHSKSPEFLQQEVYARLIMYNFGIFLANQAVAEYEKKKPGNKYRYSIDFSAALRKAKDYYLRRPAQKPVDIIRLLCRFIHANPCRKRRIQAVCKTAPRHRRNSFQLQIGPVNGIFLLQASFAELPVGHALDPPD